MNTQALNQIAAILGTTDKNLVISVAIKTLVDAGMPIRQAYESILGEGSFEKMAFQMHAALTA